MLRVTCHSCERVMECADHMEGKKARCPHCQAVVLLPGIPTVLCAEPLEVLPADVATVLPAGPTEEPRPRRGGAADAPMVQPVMRAGTGRRPTQAGAPTGNPGSGVPVAQVIGALLIFVGALLFLGNRTGILPTFLFAGFVVMLLGGIVCALGKRSSLGKVRAPSNLATAHAPSKLLGAAKVVGGLLLGGCCGPVGVYGAAYMGTAVAVSNGLIMGFGIRWMLTGSANLIGKRVGFLVSLIPVVLLVIPACLWGPRISMERRAADGVKKKDAEILRDVLRRIEADHPGDEDFAAARATARRGLEELFEEAMAQLKASPNPKAGDRKGDEVPADPELQEAFRKLIADLSTSSDGDVYVAFHNEAKLDVPPGDKVMLILKRAQPEVKMAFPNGDAPVHPQGRAFDGEFNRKRRDTFFKAMTKAFEEVFKHKGLLVLKPLADGEDRDGKIIFEVRSAAVREPTYYTYTQEGKVTGLLFGLRVDWEFAIIDRHGEELYRKKTPSTPAHKLSLQSRRGDPDWAPYSVLMDSAYYNYSRDVIARFGLPAPEQRTQFSFTE